MSDLTMSKTLQICSYVNLTCPVCGKDMMHDVGTREENGTKHFVYQCFKSDCNGELVKDKEQESLTGFYSEDE